MSASSQKETFNTLVADTLLTDCTYESVKAIHETLNTLLEERKDDPSRSFWKKMMSSDCSTTTEQLTKHSNISMRNLSRRPAEKKKRQSSSPMS